MTFNPLSHVGLREAGWASGILGRNKQSLRIHFAVQYKGYRSALTADQFPVAGSVSSPVNNQRFDAWCYAKAVEHVKGWLQLALFLPKKFPEYLVSR